MPSIEKHCEDCMRELGKPYAEVHRWLDEFAGSAEYGFRHRRLRHHYDGMREAVRLFGEDAGMAAYIHILADLKEEGWTKGKNPFPCDPDHYVAIGLY